MTRFPDVSTAIASTSTEASPEKKVEYRSEPAGLNPATNPVSWPKLADDEVWKEFPRTGKD